MNKEKLATMLQRFWEVSRCWHDPKRATRKGMSVERAVRTLREVRDGAFFSPGGYKLGFAANKLLGEIVSLQDDSLGLELAS